MHPQNIFAESVLLFVIAVLLLLRDRGSAVASTAYDQLLAGIMFILALVRLSEFIGGTQDGHILARTIVWLMWLIPLVMFIWMTAVYRRLDTGVMIVVAAGFLISVTLMLMNGVGGYDLIPPDQRVGATNGIYQWIRTDGALSFLPFGFYFLLTIALVYLTALSFTDPTYWIFAGVTALGFCIGAIAAPSLIVDRPLSTLGSLSTIVMLVVGFVAIVMVPG